MEAFEQVCPRCKSAVGHKINCPNSCAFTKIGHSFVSKYGTVDPALTVSGRCTICGVTADSHDS